MSGKIERQYDVDEWEKLRSQSGETADYYGIRVRLSDGTVITTTSHIESDVIGFKVCFVI